MRSLQNFTIHSCFIKPHLFYCCEVETVVGFEALLRLQDKK